MHKKNIKKNKLKKIITTITLLALLTNCTTTKHRDKQLIKTLNLQNETLSTLTVSRSRFYAKNKGNLSETDKENEQHLLKALNALKKSNSAVISKLKPNKRECNCGKDERVND